MGGAWIYKSCLQHDEVVFLTNEDWQLVWLLLRFGGGAILAAPMNKYFMEQFLLPDYLGSSSDVSIVTEGGKRFVEIAGELNEVVVATATEVTTWRTG